ncbi:alpha/beta fold hydrolase [Labrys sp. (in: a-proteobacteria)]|uniref:alpha/beta fold hydrolase n=1 Tax=Labrys sp. (in: a-proteobacteria) TaxID=1917972 RepID=UPI0039E604D3
MPTPFIRLAKTALLALPLALGLAAGATPAAAKDCEDLAAGRCKVKLPGGITMAYVETGPKDGPAVLLIHGLTDNIRSWSTTMAALHKRDPGLHILAMDLRGHGQTSMPPRAACSPAPEKCFRTSDFAGDIVAFMKAKKIAKATLAGHSLGSFVTQEVALEHPELVERAVLVASSTKGVDNVALRDYVLKEPVEGSWKKALEAKGWKYPAGFYMLTPLKADPKAEDWIAKNWVVDPAADPAFLKPYVPETANVRLGTWIGASKALLATDNTERLKSFSVPVLVLWATQDSIFLEADQTWLKQSLSEAAKTKGISAFWKRYGVIPLPASGAQVSDIGHNVQWGAPDAVAADIEAFIKTGSPTSDLLHSDKPPALDHIVTEPGKAEVIKLGQPATAN